jgi:error-prone DNA polymerase
MSDPTFFEIGCRSNFSFLEGASHAEEMVTTAVRIGLSGLGLADRNTVAGVVRMHAAAKLKGHAFRPGARLCFADATPECVVYPMNRRGWAHLCRMLSVGNLRSEKGVCTLYESDLAEWAEDLVVAAMVPAFADNGAAEDYCARLARLGPVLAGRLYLALVPRYDGLDRLAFHRIAEMGRRLSLPLIASNDPFYHAPDRKPLADVMTAIREHVTVAEAGFRLQAHAERHLKDPREMARLFRAYPQAIAGSVEFFSRLHFSLDELSHQYPDEAVGGEPADLALRRLTYEGAARRFPGGVPKKVADLLAYELNLIGEKRYEPYFLTVHRIIGFARSEGILCQGRGSAANSAVCYCLGITEVNPEKTTLLFDRFISTERDEPPDIDVDFEHARRQEVIQFIYDTYGHEHAALTAAVINYRARSAGRETAKAFGLSDDVQTALSGSIWGWSTADLSEREARAAGLDLADPTTRRVLDHASALVGFPRHLSQHVGGFVITRDRLDEVVPIMNTADGRYMIEWNKDDLDTLKILKIDVLALGMLTCLAKAIGLLDQHYGRQLTLASFFEDHRPEVYDMICRADTLGVFQIESRAQMSMLPRLKPREFYDLVIEVAIVRPGPIQGNMVHPYLKNRKERENGGKITYPKPELETVLARTLGVPLFQEQAMQIAITAAGFAPAEADQLRRAMATFRRTGQVANFRQRFIDGMMRRDYTLEFAERCFSQIEGFGEYGFPESHAASFALLVYASAWIKTFYPDVFCAALLNSQPMGFYAPAQLVRDAREHGVEVRPVDVNASSWDSTLETDGFDPRRLASRHASMRNVILGNRAVRLGFRQVKGLSEPEMELLVTRRGSGYASVRDLWMRTGLPRVAVERLADADAFSSLGLSRREALWAAQALDHQAAVEHLPLFADAAVDAALQVETAVSLPSMPAGEEVVSDYRALSLSLKAHPLAFLREAFVRSGILVSVDLEKIAHGCQVEVAGLVLVRQRPGSAKGVIFMTIEDEAGVANIIVWPKTFERYRSIVMGARLVRVRGRLQKAEGVIHVVAEHLIDETERLGLLREEVQGFGGLAHADEVRRPVNEHRHDSRSTGSLARLIRDVPDLVGEVRQAMPKGRNFH